AAQRQWGRGGLGLHCGVELRFGEMGVLDYVVACASTLGEGLSAAARASMLLSAGATRLEFERDGSGHGYLRHVGPYPLEVRDFSTAALVRRLRRFGAAPRAIAMVGPPLAKPAAYERCLGLQPLFHAEEGAIEIGAELLDAPLGEGALPGLAPILEREVSRLVNEAGREEVAAAVRRAVARALPSGAPSLTAVARRLGMSTRTLQRRLSEQGLSLRVLVEDTRYQLARHPLRARPLRIAEIAFLLGYAEPATFARAFKRWAGCAPSEFRRACLAGPAPGPRTPQG
ncbi:MAG: AraC family transcriptional regulator, partial [Deltaproteobacteria bacterium]